VEIKRGSAESCRRSNEGLMNRKGRIEAGMMGNVLRENRSFGGRCCFAETKIVTLGGRQTSSGSTFCFGGGW
jgi:hypothetical protein